MCSRLLIIMALVFALPAWTLAADDNKGQHKGPGTSMEHKAEQGQEHGKAYAGSHEKMEKADKTMDKSGKETREKKAKKNK